MGKPFGLEELREIFKDRRLHMTLAVVASLELAPDRSALRVTCTIFPELNKINALMTWDHVGPEAGIFAFPAVGDLVLVGYGEGEIDQAFVLKRLTSKDDKIPIQAASGDSVFRALAGKKAHILSNSAILLGRGGADPTEPLVLGTVFQTAYSTHLDEDSKHLHMGNLGYLTSKPNNEAQFLALKASPVDDALMLSDISKTEK